MRNLKRVLSLALALVMVLGMMVITTSAATFDDDAEITNKEAVEVMYALGILEGDGTGNFNPTGTFTRAGAAKVLTFMMLGADYAENNLIGTSVFADVPADHWAAKYVAYCSNLEIIKGDGTGNFLPNGTLRVVDWAKLVLGAIGYDAAKYTGNGWEQKVKNDIEKAKLDVVAITTDPISREDACWMALEAMKVGTETGTVYYYDVEGMKHLTYDSYLDVYVYFKTILGDDFAAANIKDKKVTTDSLLDTIHELNEIDPDAGDYGIPGVGYEKTVKGKKVIDLFFANEKVAEYKGEVKGGKLFTDLGSPKAELSFTMYVDGVEAAFEASVAKDSKDAVKGDLIEVYANGKDAYRVVVVNNYAGTVSEFVEANEKEEEPAYIVVNGIEYETEDFAEGDDVLYTVDNGEIKTIEKAEATVAGTPTKKANGTWTIGGKAYTLSEKSVATLELGEEGEWYVDANGKLIANKVGDGPQDPDPVYNYGYLLNYAKQAYVEAGTTDDLLGQGSEEVEAKEIFKFVNTDGAVVTLNGAVKVKDGKTTFAAKDFEYGAKGIMFQYELDENGNIKSAEQTGKDAAASSVKGGTATVEGWVEEEKALLLTDDSVIVMAVKGEDEKVEYKAAVGYKNVADASFGSAIILTDKGLVKVAVLVDAKLDKAPPKGEDGRIYIAGTDCYVEWDATGGEDGKGAPVYVYENVYINGVKDTLTLEDELEVAEGLYEYNTVKGVDPEAKGNLLGDEGVVTLIQSGFFMADEIVYTDAKTVYYEISEDGLAVAAGLPAVKDFETTILVVESKDDVATYVYFSAVEIEE